MLQILAIFEGFRGFVLFEGLSFEGLSIRGFVRRGFVFLGLVFLGLVSVPFNGALCRNLHYTHPPPPRGEIPV